MRLDPPPPVLWIGRLRRPCVVGPKPNQTKPKRPCCVFMLLHCALQKVNRLDGLVRTLALYGVLERNAIDSSK